MARIVRRVFGSLFVLLGAVVIVRGAEVNLYHSLRHIATGLAALSVGCAGSPAAAKAFARAFGRFYLALGGLGMLVGDPTLSRRLELA
jgi:hypothetical protein